MSPQFEIGGYTIKLGRRLAARVADQTVTATGSISFLGEKSSKSARRNMTAWPSTELGPARACRRAGSDTAIHSESFASP